MSHYRMNFFCPVLMCTFQFCKAHLLFLEKFDHKMHRFYGRYENYNAHFPSCGCHTAPQLQSLCMVKFVALGIITYNNE